MEKTEIFLAPELTQFFNSVIKSSFTNQEKAQLAAALSAVCQIQRQYGKTADAFSVMIQTWCWVLDGHAMPEILEGLRKAVKESSDIPTPHDVLKKINGSARHFDGQFMEGVQYS